MGPCHPDSLTGYQLTGTDQGSKPSSTAFVLQVREGWASSRRASGLLRLLSATPQELAACPARSSLVGCLCVYVCVAQVGCT